MDTPIMTAVPSILAHAIHTPEPFEFPSESPLSPLIYDDDCGPIHTFITQLDYTAIPAIPVYPEHDISMSHQRTESTLSTQDIQDIPDETDPPNPNETPEQTLTRLVDMLSTIEFKEMDEYGPEYRVNIGEAYERFSDDDYSHVMLTKEFVWLNVQNTNETDNTRFLNREIVYETCASYFINCCLNGDMRYTSYPDGTISYWVRLDLQTTRLMRKVLEKSRSVERTPLMTELLESLVDDVVDAIEDVEPLRIYINKVFLGRRE